MRNYVIISLVLLFAGVAASIYLMPTPDDLASMQRRDRTAVQASATADESTPIVTGMRALSDRYNASGDYAKQAEILEQIIALTQGAEPQVYVDLATVQLLLNHGGQALDTLGELTARHPDFSSYALTRNMVSALADTGSIDQAFTLAKEWMDVTPAADTRQNELADLCNILLYRGHDAGRAIALVAPYTDLLDSQPQLVLSYTNASIAAGHDMGALLERVSILAATVQPPPEIIDAWLKLAAATGRHDLLKPWLESAATDIPAAQWRELFYLANNRKHHTLAGAIAERIYAVEATPENRDIMLSAYLAAGDHAKALPLLRDSVNNPKDDDALYISSLTALARRDAAASRELTDYAGASLQAGRGDDNRQIRYARILIEYGKKAETLPLIKSKAAEKGGAWEKLYAQLSESPPKAVEKKTTPHKVKKEKMSQEELLALAHDQTIAAADKRQVAMRLLEDADQDAAVTLFMEMARDKDPQSQEVIDLFSLWGGRLGGESLAWVVARAAAASANEKQKWGNLVASMADDNSVLRYVGAMPDALYNQTLRRKYLNVLADTGSNQHYDVAMREWVAQTTDVAALLDYATIGQSSGYLKAAAAGYARVLALDPDNSKAQHEMETFDSLKTNSAAGNYPPQL